MPGSIPPDGDARPAAAAGTAGAAASRVTRATDAVQRVHHHLVFQEDVAPVESYGVRPAVVLTAVAVVVAVIVLATDAGAGTGLWFVRASSVLAVVVGLVGTPLLTRRRNRLRAGGRPPV